MSELREAVLPEYREMVDIVVELYETDDKPWLGIIKKLLARGYTRRQAREFLASVRQIVL